MPTTAEDCERVLSQSLAQYFVTELRKNQTASLRQHLPDSLTVLFHLIEQRDEEHSPALQKYGKATSYDFEYLQWTMDSFQNFFLEEQDDGITGLELIMVLLKDEKLVAETAGVLCGLSQENGSLLHFGFCSRYPQFKQCSFRASTGQHQGERGGYGSSPPCE